MAGSLALNYGKFYASLRLWMANQILLISYKMHNQDLTQVERRDADFQEGGPFQSGTKFRGSSEEQAENKAGSIVSFWNGDSN
ncbi:MAG: hypothetical protein HQK56_06295 [Deltaproteobacteria bacterium]|nr:hypothetical protein [Deltaproteobacteria bacterium]